MPLKGDIIMDLLKSFCSMGFKCLLYSMALYRVSNSEGTSDLCVLLACTMSHSKNMNAVVF